MTNTADRTKLFNAHIVDVENGGYYPPGVSLVIQDGMIAAMPGLDEAPDDFPADTAIDLQGRTVIPGLFNTHCHLGFLPKGEAGVQQGAKNLRDCLEHGVTNIRDTLCYDLQVNRSWRNKIQRGEIPGPRIHQAIHVGPLGDTYAPRLNAKTRFQFGLIGMKLVGYDQATSGVVAFRPDAGLQEVRDAVDRAIDERGADAVKFCDQPEHFMTYKPGAEVITPEQLEAAVDQAVRRGMPTTMHNVTVAGLRMGARAGVGSLAHLPLDSALTEADAAALLNSPTFIEPTLSVGYFMSYSIKGSPFYGDPELQRLDHFREESYRAIVEETWLPELLPSRMALHENLSQGGMKVFGVIDISEPFRYYSKMIPTGGQNLRMLVEHGAACRLACGNDSGPTNASPAAIGHELAMFDFVLNYDGPPLVSAAELLRAATIQSARSMGVEDRFGSIQPGKTADLVVLEGDPLQDFRLIGRPVQALFMEGMLVINRCGLEAVHTDGVLVGTGLHK